MVLVSAILGGALAAPIWFVWIGVTLRRGVSRAGVVEPAVAGGGVKETSNG
jgi:hypothetical protein